MFLPRLSTRAAQVGLALIVFAAVGGTACKRAGRGGNASRALGAVAPGGGGSNLLYWTVAGGEASGAMTVCRGSCRNFDEGLPADIRRARCLETVELRMLGDAGGSNAAAQTTLLKTLQDSASLDAVSATDLGGMLAGLFDAPATGDLAGRSPDVCRTTGGVTLGYAKDGVFAKESDTKYICQSACRFQSQTSEGSTLTRHVNLEPAGGPTADAAYAKLGESCRQRSADGLSGELVIVSGEAAEAVYRSASQGEACQENL